MRRKRGQTGLETRARRCHVSGLLQQVICQTVSEGVGGPVAKVSREDWHRLRLRLGRLQCPCSLPGKPWQACVLKMEAFAGCLPFSGALLPSGGDSAAGAGAGSPPPNYWFAECVASGWPGRRRLPVFALPVSSRRSGSWVIPLWFVEWPPGALVFGAPFVPRPAELPGRPAYPRPKAR